MLVLALAGLAIAGYLSYEHATSGTAVCLTGGGCETVQNSKHLQLAGIYIPYIALAGYAGIVVSLLLRRPGALLAAVAMAYFGVAMTAYVTYLQAFVIEAWCMWCVISTVLMWTIAGLGSREYLRKPA